jgi:hypothetical protein
MEWWGSGDISMLSEMRDEPKSTETASLREAINALTNLEIDRIVMKERFY